MKFAFALAGAAFASNTINLVEQKMQALFHQVQAQVATPSNGMVFEQEDAGDYFLMDDSQTFGTPDPPQTAGTEVFTLGGIFFEDVHMAYVNFTCKIFGVLVFNENFPNDELISAGAWSYNVPFDVPSVAPQTTYYVEVYGYDVEDNMLFDITTDFTF